MLHEVSQGYLRTSFKQTIKKQIAVRHFLLVQVTRTFLKLKYNKTNKNRGRKVVVLSVLLPFE